MALVPSIHLGGQEGFGWKNKLESSIAGVQLRMGEGLLRLRAGSIRFGVGLASRVWVSGGFYPAALWRYFAASSFPCLAPEAPLASPLNPGSSSAVCPRQAGVTSVLSRWGSNIASEVLELLGRSTRCEYISDRARET